MGKNKNSRTPPTMWNLPSAAGSAFIWWKARPRILKSPIRTTWDCAGLFMGKNKNCYIGLGFDSHSFGTVGTLVLGGVLFQGTPRLKGHSDGDALLHAVIDALLGAAGLGDIGEMFPDTDNKIKGISSVVMLKKVLAEVRRNKFRVGNVDITVVADRPRLSPHKEKNAPCVGPAAGRFRGARQHQGQNQRRLDLV
jgi:2-C-methyl-D-erythritol 2,4-cyclodiphosphate synthase